MKKMLWSLIISCAFVAPLPMAAGYNYFQPDHDRDYYYRDRDGRYYDPGYRDYHEWNEREQRAWHRYWVMRHRREIAWERARERERREYWRWRHEHRDDD